MSNKIQELPPESFRFGNKGAGIPFHIYVSSHIDFAEWMKSQIILGKSQNPEYRGELEEYTAVLFEYDGWEGWAHVPNGVIEIYEKELLI